MVLKRRFQADLWILALSAVWGSTFIVIKEVLDDVSPLLFVTIRFLLAAVLLLPLVLPLAERRSISAAAVRAGCITGLLLLAGYACQTLGLELTTPSRSAFITGMAVVFTPLIAVLLKLRRPLPSSLIGALVAVAGLYLLTGVESGGGFGLGELLTLFCAVFFAGHLLAIDLYTRRHDKRVIAWIQIAFVGVAAMIPTFLVEHLVQDRIRLVIGPRLLIAIGVTSVLATAIAFLVLNLVQSWTTPTRAAIILVMEPVFAAVTAWLVAGETLEGSELVGAGLILTGMIVSEIAPPRPPNRDVAGDGARGTRA